MDERLYARKVSVVKRAVFGLVLALTAAGLSAQGFDKKNSISVSFAIDGEPTPCDDLRVEQRVDKVVIPAKLVGHGFIVPELFFHLYANPRSREESNIDIHVRCGGHTLDFPGLNPVQVLPGVWEVGIRYPTSWLIDDVESPLLEKADWYSYLATDCNDCDPGLITKFAHFDLPSAFAEDLVKEQPQATGERAMDVAYALAVFNSDYQQNRDYLFSMFEACLSNPSRPVIEDICDDRRLYKELANLYWRGDNDLLLPLLRAAEETRAGAVDGAGRFYADLLDRRNAEFLLGLGSLPVENQKTVCKLAGRHELILGSAKEERVAKQLRANGGDLALRCLHEIEETKD